MIINKQNILIGKTINKVMLADDRKAILFKTKDGDIKVMCGAKCCSSTWVEQIELPVNGFPATVFSVEDIGLEANEGTLKYYGCKITTNKGEIMIDYRNESNGYYGGNLSWPGEDFFTGVFDQNISEEQWNEIQN